MTTRTKETQLKKTELEITVKRLIEKRDEYEERLDIGGAKIEEARNQGRDVTTWEDYWISLLRQYEAVAENLRECQAELAVL